MLFHVDPLDYRIANAGAHRKPPPMVGAPALIWRYSLWCPEKTSEIVWLKTVDYLLYTIYRVLNEDPRFGEKTVSPNYAHKENRLYLFRHYVEMQDSAGDWKTTKATLIEILPNTRTTRYDVFSVRTFFSNLPLTIRAERYSEFWTIDFIADFDQIDPSLISVPDGPLSHYAEDFNYLFSFIKQRHKDNNRCEISVETKKEDKNKIKIVRDHLHKRFRDLISGSLLGPCVSRYLKCYLDDSGSSKNLGSVFAEFHGAVFGFTPGEDSIEPIPLGCNFPPTRRKTIPAQIGNAKFTPSAAIKLVDALWPVIKEVQRSSDIQEEKDEDRYGKPEFTVSLFQSRRSMYISSLGWLDPPLESTKIRPVVYTIIVSYQSRWSLGRLVERINTMGTLRLAALRDLELIVRAGDELKALQDDVRALAGAYAPSRVSELLEKCLGVGNDIRYGLMHRVERSQYYFREFERNLANLRFSRVEGFQPYDQFVQRRMYGAFDYIRRVGDRYRELRRELELLLQSTNSTALLKTQRVTAMLLTVAEKIIILPLIYYGGHVIEEIIYALCRLCCILLKIPVADDVWKTCEPIVTIISYILAGVGFWCFWKYLSRVRMEIESELETTSLTESRLDRLRRRSIAENAEDNGESGQ